MQLNERFPDFGHIYYFKNFVIFITLCDLQTKEGTFKYFDNLDQALQYKHDISCAQNPEWHKEFCTHCKERSL